MRTETRYRYGKIDGKIVREEVTYAYMMIGKEVQLEPEEGEEEGRFEVVEKEVESILSTFNLFPDKFEPATENDYRKQQESFEQAGQNFMIDLAHKQKEKLGL